MTDGKSDIEIIYQNCIEMFKFRFSLESQMTTSGLPSDAVTDTIPSNFGLTADKLRHEMTTAGYVLIMHKYLCILMTNPDRSIGSSLPAFRAAVTKAIAPRNSYMQGVKEIILVTEKNNDNFLGVVTALYPTDVLIRFVTMDTFACNQPKMLAFGVFKKMSLNDIERDKKFLNGPINTGVIRHDDVAVIWYGYKPGDVILSVRRSFGTIWATDIYNVSQC
jgi:hypothetical protein